MDTKLFSYIIFNILYIIHGCMCYVTLLLDFKQAIIILLSTVAENVEFCVCLLLALQLCSAGYTNLRR